ncbi:MAG: efflux RND transporter periplasmic adaptor subunit [Rikenellaceae bacterium]
MTKRGVIIALSVVVLGGVAAYLFMPKEQKEAAPEWVVSTVGSGSIVQSITATGTIEPVTSVDVGTQVSGILTTLYVDYNSVVKRGQIIAELDKSTLKLDLATNENNLATAKSALDFQGATYNRVKALHESGLIADEEYEQSLYDYEQAKNNYATAKNNVERSQINLGYATIYSPIDGVVLTREVEEGQTVASSYSTPTLFTIAADLTDMRVIADIDEADIGNVADGQRVSFTVDAYPGEMFEGTVTQVRQQATIESNVVTYEVVISAANPDLKLKPGLTASVEVFTLDVNCAAYVSAAALAFTPTFVEGEGASAPSGEQAPRGEGEMGERRGPRPEIKAGEVIWLKKGDRVVPCPVKVGITNGILTQIEGAEPGDSVVLGSKSPIVRRAPGAGEGTTNPFAPQRPGGKR